MESTIPLSAYCSDFGNYSRQATREITIGNLTLGAGHPIRMQSMSSCNPMDTEANVDQAIRIIEAGGELVRFTAPAVKDAENLKNIKQGLLEKGYPQPLVADIHFNPKAALEAAKYVEKVRINPGNYAENSKSKINYSPEEYNESLQFIEEKLIELISYCKQHHVAMRIGSNHGSLSQRIMDRYGDTPEGMVEAALEYVRIAVKHQYYDLVLSMKASNLIVMVQAYRLLAAKMKDENFNFPLHLGVTEAGAGEDGRIKSAAGIGALLEDGLGDTIRVSLTEDPEFEIPIARLILKNFENRTSKTFAPIAHLPYNPYRFQKRESEEVMKIGNRNEPIVVGYDWTFDQHKKALTANFNGHKISENAIPILTLSEYLIQSKPQNVFVTLNYNNLKEGLLEKLSPEDKAIFVFEDAGQHSVHPFRALFIYLINNNLNQPVILHRNYGSLSETELQIKAAIDFGSLLVDGLGDGIWIESGEITSTLRLTEISLNILQACRARISKTEYISCPSCGRTLFNIQQATAKVRSLTQHLKGLKIAVMGCIVNGPGEMADANYGYVGAGVGKINLYKGKEVVAKGIDESIAVEALIQLIKDHGDWKEPQ